MSKPRFQGDEMRWAQEVDDFRKRVERFMTQETYRTVNTAGQPPFLNAWTNYGQGYSSAGFMIDALGFVHLRGMIMNGAIGSAAFVMPAGYRPQSRTLFNAISSAAGGRVDVLTDGSVTPMAGSNVWISLDGLIFRAYQ